MLTQRIGFIGAGRMATAMGQGIVEADLISPNCLFASDPSADMRDRFAKATGGNTTDDNRAVAGGCDVLILAVKPSHLAEALSDLRGHLLPETLVVSIVAGARLATLSHGLGGAARLIRVMPNTPCLVREGASGFCPGPHATREDALLVRQLLESLGVAVEVEEPLLDVVTGLSGSGPAFAYMIIEALGDGAVRMGLPRAVATTLAAQTLRGAAAMVLRTGEHPGVLKDRVTSPGGTTIAGIQALEAGGVRGALMAAVEAATRRSIELAGTP
ncbi:MAG: pyrroline-5-carboxylate reductase [Pirellulales bacterium]|nr:pyrroline-5-carboxylate reductase [Pirellulales bacterium]